MKGGYSYVYSLSLVFLSLLVFPFAAIRLSSYESVYYVSLWIVFQWFPNSWPIRSRCIEASWRYWEGKYGQHSFATQDIPTVHVQDHLDDLHTYIETTFGDDWRKRPLLFKGLLTADALSDDRRRLSLAGLLREDMTIPYFTDARRKGALTPDGRARVKDIVSNITEGAPHKITSQFVVQSHPELIEEVAPIDTMTQLFGNYFTPNHLKPFGPFGIIPPLTTVPLFVATGKPVVRDHNNRPEKQLTAIENDDAKISRPYTSLHCEPISNIAVQLSGRKQWTLVRPEFSYLLRPSIAPDRRAFFASLAPDFTKLVPSYQIMTMAGDAIYVPTWTWHQVDYVESPDEDDVSIAASLFHFRSRDFLVNNPLFALMIIPSLVLELLGVNTQ